MGGMAAGLGGESWTQAGGEEAWEPAGAASGSEGGSGTNIQKVKKAAL